MSTEFKEDTATPIFAMRTAEVAAAIGFVAFGTVMLYDNLKIGIAWTEYGPEAGMFPFGLSVALVALGICALVAALRTPESPGAPGFLSREDIGPLSTIVLPTILFVVLTGWLGIYLSGFLLIAGFMTFFGGFRWHLSVVTAAAVILGLFWLFEIEFRVFLPKGPVEAFLGY